MRGNDYKVEIDGKLVTLAELKTAYRFWKEYHWDAGDTACPICGRELSESDLFVCCDCGSLLPLDEESPYTSGVCRDCDKICREQAAYEDAVNAEIDRMRGK